MKPYKKLGLILFLVCLAGKAFALEIEFISNGMGGIDGGLLGSFKTEIEGIHDNPQNFIRGFADASVFASHGATQRAYGDYNIFAFTIGPMIGFRLPGSLFNAMGDIQDTADRLEREHDLKFGVNIQAINAEVGINISFLVDRLYLGLRFGYFNLTNDLIENINFKILHTGMVAHYRLLKGIDLGVFKWRGITAETGFLYQKTTLGYTYVLDGSDSSGFTAKDPTLNFDMQVTTYTIPLEVNTSILLIKFLNLNVGLGTDFAFGKNDMSINLHSPIYDNSDTYQGYLRVKGGGKMSPTILNPKVMANLGFQFGPVLLDVPITYYFTNSGSGLSAGVTLGIVF
ncbi:MAG: hypothetical protein FWG27_09040 [Treponema sp.]|nr:hypothetical protein [Treponema sp.]